MAEAARVELLAGDPAAAERVARAGYESLAQLGEKGYLSGLAPRLARAICLQGRYQEAEHFTRAGEGGGGLRRRRIAERLAGRTRPRLRQNGRPRGR